MLLIQTYSATMFPPSLQKGEGFGAEQVAEVRALEEEACLRGAQLQSLLQKWEEFDDNCASLEKDLEVLISSLPSLSLVEETEERLLERISFYQQIKRNIDAKHARLCQTLNEGRQLAASVSCPEPEAQIAKLEEQWLSLNKRIDQELHRLQTLLKHLLSYSRDSDELTRWLESSQQTLNYWKEQSLNVSQDLNTIRSNIDRFFLQMEKLPSREAISEMISWMNTVEPQVVGEDAELPPSSVSLVKRLLQKLKIQYLEQLLESITENENKIQNVNSWLEAQEKRLKTLQKPESAVSMEKLLLDCQDVENQLAVKSKALDELRQSSLTMDGGDRPLLEDMASGINELCQKRNSVTSQVHQLRASVQTVLQEWKACDKLYDEAHMKTAQLTYSMEHSKPAVLSLQALDCQVQNLEALQDEAENGERSWEKLLEVIGRLKDSCPSIAGIIEEKYQDAHA
ncbi:rCG62130, isoform CRA_b, partial [Rattus norvegicus]